MSLVKEQSLRCVLCQGWRSKTEAIAAGSVGVLSEIGASSALVSCCTSVSSESSVTPTPGAQEQPERRRNCWRALGLGEKGCPDAGPRAGSEDQGCRERGRGVGCL